jgi:ATP-dependent RNA helicase DDX23/PRP28
MNAIFTLQPKFLTKEERAVEAMKKRQEQVDELRRRQEEERNKRMNFEREAGDSRKSDRERDREARRRERDRDRERQRDREKEMARDNKDEKGRTAEVSLKSYLISLFSSVAFKLITLKLFDLTLVL